MKIEKIFKKLEKCFSKEYLENNADLIYKIAEIIQGKRIRNRVEYLRVDIDANDGLINGIATGKDEKSININNEKVRKNGKH